MEKYFKKSTLYEGIKQNPDIQQYNIPVSSNQSKCSEYAVKQENVTYNQDKNHAKETDTETTEITD